MKFDYLSSTVNIKKISETDTEGVFEIEGLYPGFGITIGNALRRVLFSSLPGAVITRIKIKGINHEFSTLPGMTEDVVELILNLKKIRFRAHTDDPQVLTLKVKGEKKITAADIKTNPQVEIITPKVHIAALTGKSAELDIELVVDRGLGYVPAEAQKQEKLPIGEIVLDAAFSPVVKANFNVENMRVGDRTDYNRLRIAIETDGAVSPSAALRKVCNVLQDHFIKISQIKLADVEETGPDAASVSDVTLAVEESAEKKEKKGDKKSAK